MDFNAKFRKNVSAKDKIKKALGEYFHENIPFKSDSIVDEAKIEHLQKVFEKYTHCQNNTPVSVIAGTV